MEIEIEKKKNKQTKPYELRNIFILGIYGGRWKHTKIRLSYQVQNMY